MESQAQLGLLRRPTTTDKTERGIRSSRAKRKPKTEIFVNFQHADWPQQLHQKTYLNVLRADLERNKTSKTEDRLELANGSRLIKRAEDSYVYR